MIDTILLPLYLFAKRESGGVFKFASNIRSADDENYDAVLAILGGGESGMSTFPFKAESLEIFMGRYFMHCVTESTGKNHDSSHYSIMMLILGSND